MQIGRDRTPSARIVPINPTSIYLDFYPLPFTFSSGLSQTPAQLRRGANKCRFVICRNQASMFLRKSRKRNAVELCPLADRVRFCEDQVLSPGRSENELRQHAGHWGL